MSEARPAELITAMFDAALAARKNAYVPGCDFPVGACLRNESGALFVGVNVENPVPAMSICAETTALGALIASGSRHISDVLVIGGTLDLCPPCGGCRQRLMPFADAGTLVHLCTIDGRRETIPFTRMLPMAGTR